MSNDPVSQLVARLQTDADLRTKVIEADSDTHRAVLSEAGLDHHEQLDDEQLAAVVGGVTADGMTLTEQQIQQVRDANGGFGAGFTGP